MSTTSPRAIARIVQLVNEDGSVDLVFDDLDPETSTPEHGFSDHYEDPTHATSFLADCAERYTAPKLAAYRIRAMHDANHWNDENLTDETHNGDPDLSGADDIAQLACGCKLLRSKGALLSACPKHAAGRAVDGEDPTQ